MGAFIFLRYDSRFAGLVVYFLICNRFISPAIVAPETIDIELPKDLSREEHMVIRRGLMVIAKIIQNLANNLFFGKEKHMVPLNTFLQANIASVTRFLSELNVGCSSPVERQLIASVEISSTHVRGGNRRMARNDIRRHRHHRPSSLLP